MLGKYIHELLFQFNSVSIPGFGTLKKASETIPVHPVDSVFSPPSVNLEFDANQKFNDGVLANYIAEKEKISFVDALSKIRTFVEQIQQKLDTEKSYTLGQLGEFSTLQNDIKFKAHEGITFDAAYFGLAPIQAKPILRERQTEVKPVVVSKKRKVPVFRIIFLSILGLILICVAALFIAKPHRNPKYSEYFKSVPLLNEGNNKAKMAVLSKTNIQSSLAENFIRIFFGDLPAVDSLKIQKPEKINKTTENHANQVTTVQSGNYLIIAGSFKLKENADNYVLKLSAKGYTPEIIQASNGMYMVSYRRYSDQASAGSDLEKIKSTENPSAWVLKY